ncbi:hypothetical protein RUND412_000316 [Rhizina undulata]
MATAFGNRRDVVFADENLQLNHAYSTEGSSNWTVENLGGRIFFEPALVARSSTRLDVFAVGEDSSVLHKWWDGSAWNNGFENLGGNALEKPVAVSWGPNRLDLFIVGEDRAIYHRAFANSAWNAWEKVPNSSAMSELSAITFQNHLNVFYIGPGNVVYHNWSSGNGQWNAEKFGGTAVSKAPKVVTPADNRVHLFYIGQDSKLRHKYWNGSEWVPNGVSGYGEVLGAPNNKFIQYNIDAAVSGSNRVHVFAVGSDFSLYRKHWDGTSFSSEWENLGGGNILTASPLASGINGGADVYHLGYDKRTLYHKGWVGPEGSIYIAGILWDTVASPVILL